MRICEYCNQMIKVPKNDKAAVYAHQSCYRDSDWKEWRGYKRGVKLILVIGGKVNAQQQ